MSSIQGGRPPYEGLRTFMRSEHTRDMTGVDVAVVGIPLDTGTTNRPGARFGPNDIRDVSLRRCSGANPRYGVDPSEKLKIVDYGDFNLVLGDINASVNLIHKQMFGLLKTGVHTVALGGDHTITYPILKAHYEYTGRPIALVHFDAHHDYWDDNYGTEIAHGTWLYHAIKEGFVDVEHSFMLGVRCPSDPKHVQELKKMGMTVWNYDEIYNFGIQKSANVMKTVIGDRPVYLTFDVDGLDPAYAPGTGTPEPGGFTTNEAMQFLFHLRSLNWQGMDIVEVAPVYDVGQITSVAASAMIWNYLSGLALKNDNSIKQRRNAQ